MGRETTSWSWLRNGILLVSPLAHLERVENGLSAGMADVNYLIDGTEGWIETKAVLLPKRERTAVLGREKGLRDPEQINWHLTRSSRRGRTYVFISAAPYRWLIEGAFADRVNSWNAEELSTYASMWKLGPWAQNDWVRLCQALTLR